MDCSIYLLSRESITNTAAFVTHYRYEWSLNNPPKLCFFPFSILKDNLNGFFFSQLEMATLNSNNAKIQQNKIQDNSTVKLLWQSSYFLSSFYFVFLINNWCVKSDFLCIVSWLWTQTLNSICFIYLKKKKSSTLKTWKYTVFRKSAHFRNCKSPSSSIVAKVEIP